MRGTFLYNDGPVTTLNDANLLFRRRTTSTRSPTTPTAPPPPTPLLNDVPVAPSNVGTASIPDYSALRKQAVAAGAIAGGAGGQSYVGQADDPFFLDLRVFDLLYGTDLKEAGFDTLKNFNVNTIALQVPKATLAGGGNAANNPVVGIWSTTSRSTTRTLAATNAAGAQSHLQRRARPGLPPRQPARQRGRRPGAAQGPLQPVHPGQGRRSSSARSPTLSCRT